MNSPMLSGRLRRRLETNRPLASMTTIKAGGAAEFYLEPTGIRDVADAVSHCAGRGRPVRVLGGGSNLLVADEGIRGLVLNLGRLRGIRVLGGRVMAQAGARLSAVLAACIRAGIAGPELLAGIPGVLGGALSMNAGSRQVDIGRFVERVLWVSPDGQMRELYRDEIEFRYRESSLSRGVVLEATIAGSAGEPAALGAEAARIAREKRASQPYDKPSFGCSFRNPEGLSAGRLIDLAGCKGLRRGDAQVSPQHANFILNLGSARADDVLGLMGDVARRVFETHGVRLQPEVRLWSDNDKQETFRDSPFRPSGRQACAP